MTAVAIDFGTSNTVVSILEADTQTPTTLRLGAVSRLFKLRGKSGQVLEMPVVPSLLYVQGADKIVIGEQVRSQRLGAKEPQRLFKGFKRDLAADFSTPPRQLDGVNYEAAKVAGLFLRSVWEEIQGLGVEPTQLILTVPVGSFEAYLSWFQDFSQRLGVEMVRYLDEATAAALGYGLKHPGALVLAIDFGGGTLDLSLVRTDFSPGSQKLQAQVIAKTDAYIGGEDIDIWIVEYYLQKIGNTREALTEITWQNLLELGERIKLKLSKETSASETWLNEENLMAAEFNLTRDEFESILENNQFFRYLRDSLEEILELARSKGIQNDDIERILLVGGSCLIPAVQEIIVTYFGSDRVKLGKPFEAVCHGALALASLTKVEDYLHHSYGIRLWQADEERDDYFTLFQKGDKYPTEEAKTIILQPSNEEQKEIRLDIGELADVFEAETSYNERGLMMGKKIYKRQSFHPLGTQQQSVCIAHLQPPGKKGRDRLKVSFEVNERRILLATIKDLETEKVLVEKGAIAKLK